MLTYEWYVRLLGSLNNGVPAHWPPCHTKLSNNNCILGASASSVYFIDPMYQCCQRCIPEQG